MSEAGSISRRSFIGTTATTAAATLVSRHVLGGPRFVPPSDKVNVGYVGVATSVSGRRGSGS
jgi:hypothetical protein